MALYLHDSVEIVPHKHSSLFPASYTSSLGWSCASSTCVFPFLENLTHFLLIGRIKVPQPEQHSLTRPPTYTMKSLIRATVNQTDRMCYNLICDVDWYFLKKVKEYHTATFSTKKQVHKQIRPLLLIHVHPVFWTCTCLSCKGPTLLSQKYCRSVLSGTM